MKLINLFKIAIDFLCKKKTSYILSIVICTFLFYFFDLYIISYDETLYNEKNALKLFDVNSDELYYINYDNVMNEQYEKFYKALYKMSYIEDFGVLCNSSSFFWEKGVDYSKFFSLSDGGQDIHEDSDDGIMLDMFGTIGNALNIVDTYGKKLQYQYHENAIPIYVGSSYMNTIPIGTIFKGPSAENNIDVDTNLDEVNFIYDNYIVIGYIGKNQKIPEDNFMDLQQSNNISLDKAIICMKNVPKNVNSNEFYFKESNLELVESHIRKLSRIYNVDVKISTLQEITNNIKKSKFEDMKPKTFLMFLTLFMAIIAITSTSVIMLIVKKNQIGIMYSCGVTKRDMSKIIIIINLLCTHISLIAAFLLRTLYSNRIYQQEEQFKELKILHKIRFAYVLGQLEIICLFIVVLSSFISIKILKKYSIYQLIGNNED